jgi:hypothetical protein
MLLLSGTFLAFMVGGATFVNWLVEPDMVRARARARARLRVHLSELAGSLAWRGASTSACPRCV